MTAGETPSIEERMEAIFKEIFWTDRGSMRELTKLSSSHWDSMAHMNLLLCIEEEFGMSLTDQDILDLNSFEVAVEIVREKLAAAVESHHP